jgi:hypothetical protein
MLAKKKNLTGNPTCPPFARCAKKVFNALADNATYHPMDASAIQQTIIQCWIQWKKITTIKEMRKNRRMKLKLLWNHPT